MQKVIAIYDTLEGGTFIMVLPVTFVGDYSMGYKLVDLWQFGGQRYALYECEESA